MSPKFLTRLQNAQARRILDPKRTLVALKAGKETLITLYTVRIWCTGIPLAIRRVMHVRRSIRWAAQIFVVHHLSCTTGLESGIVRLDPSECPK